MNEPLSKRQREALACIDRHLAAHQRGPSVRELAQALGGVWANAAQWLVRALRRKGYLASGQNLSGTAASTGAMSIICRQSGDYCLIGGQWYLWQPEPKETLS